MLEIITLFFLCKKMGALAQQKGLKPSIWKLYTVLCWFGAEIGGVIIGLGTFGKEYVYPSILLGLACAVVSYFILRSSLNQRPDILDDDINRIGVDDLRP